MNPEPSELELLRATHDKWHRRIKELERENRAMRRAVNNMFLLNQDDGFAIVSMNMRTWELLSRLFPDD